MRPTTLKIAPLYLAFLAMVNCSNDNSQNPKSQASTTSEIPKAANRINSLYNQSCISCHLSGTAGAPRAHDVAAWKPRLAKGMNTLLLNAKQGINAMPAKGMCVDCTDTDLEALITFMASTK